jgi:extracellular matrix regulatory protein A
MLKNSLINIGFGNAIAAERVIAVITPLSASGKRIREEAKENNFLIDATHGRKTRAIIIMDSNHVILSAMQPETIANRLNHAE